MGVGNQAKRRARRIRRAAMAHHAQAAQAAQANVGDNSATKSDTSHKEDDKKNGNQNGNRRHRRNSSSVDGDNELVALDMNPAVSNLVRGAAQSIGSGEQDGTTMALAATNAPSPAVALNLLAASAAMANVRLERVGRHTAHALTELQHLEDSPDNLELQVLTARVAQLEGVLTHLVSILRNAAVDTTEVEDMLSNLNV